jgi:hypothetical protein
VIRETSSSHCNCPQVLRDLTFVHVITLVAQPTASPHPSVKVIVGTAIVVKHATEALVREAMIYKEDLTHLRAVVPEFFGLYRSMGLPCWSSRGVRSYRTALRISQDKNGALTPFCFRVMFRSGLTVP